MNVADSGTLRELNLQSGPGSAFILLNHLNMLDLLTVNYCLLSVEKNKHTAIKELVRLYISEK